MAETFAEAASPLVIVHGVPIDAARYGRYDAALHGPPEQFATAVWNGLASALGIRAGLPDTSMEPDIEQPLPDVPAVNREGGPDAGELFIMPTTRLLGRLMLGVADEVRTGVAQKLLAAMGQHLVDAEPPLPLRQTADGWYSAKISKQSVRKAVHSGAHKPVTAARQAAKKLRDSLPPDILLDSRSHNSYVVTVAPDRLVAGADDVDLARAEPCVSCPFYRNNRDGVPVCELVEACPPQAAGAGIDGVRDVGRDGRHLLGRYAADRRGAVVPVQCPIRILNKHKLETAKTIHRFLPPKIGNLQGLRREISAIAG